ncbi:ABC transporter permease [Gorillibacterium sp. sgz5001074]|uniref:ABC transporter permease n=1 Tax=Gorillibacterium sp. sgz5001074 TaxID=3446695 RepID=UPI003F678133
MTKWMVLYQKEMLELWRSGKWLWVPVVFILLGVMNPITSYFLPDILQNAGNLPEGAVIRIPPPTPSEVMAKTLSQYDTMGVLILVLATMGTVAAERAGGIASMILVKPVSHLQYLSAKWAGMLSLALASYTAGYGAAWYYTEYLIGHVEPSRTVAAGAVWAAWLALILTVTLLLSACLRSSGAVAFVTLFLAAALSIVSGLFSRYTVWSPGRLSGYAGAVALDGMLPEGLPWSLAVTVGLSAVLLAASVRVLRRQELSE